MPKIKSYPYNGEETIYAHGKRDGIYLRIENKRAFTSLDTDITDKVNNYTWFKNIILTSKYLISPHCAILGELYCKGFPASEVKHRLATGQKLDFDCFAITEFGDGCSLENLEEYCNKIGINFAPYLFPNSFGPIETYKDLLKIDPDFEGIVYKNGNFGKWYKWKPIKTIDGYVENVKPGKGKYVGMVGSLEIAVLHKPEQNIHQKNEILIANISGFTDEERKSLFKNIYQKVVEVKYQYIGSQGKLRHPRFSRFRDDKLWHECLTDQDTDLFNFWNKFENI